MPDVACGYPHAGEGNVRILRNRPHRGESPGDRAPMHSVPRGLRLRGSTLPGLRAGLPFDAAAGRCRKTKPRRTVVMIRIDRWNWLWGLALVAGTASAASNEVVVDGMRVEFGVVAAEQLR